MSKELVIGSNRHETKVAILEDDQLAEIYFQRGNEYSLAGSIHKGRVTRVLPGMQSAFVDLGLERDTFLYVSDFFEENEEFDALADDKPVRNDRRERTPNRSGDRGDPRPIEKPQLVQMPVQQPPPVEAEEPDELGGEPEIEPVAASEGVESRAPDTGDGGDRSGFRGDRRGRRSRRRRSRGRGFPDNKYAQATDVKPAESHREVVPPVESLETEVILLPGESLAKYRRPELSSKSPEEPAEPSITEQPEQLEEAGEIDEELDAEAAELEFVDKIFSHNDDLSIEDEESKIEEVKEDQPESDFLVEDIDAEDPSDADITPLREEPPSETFLAIESHLVYELAEEEQTIALVSDEDSEVAAARAYLTSDIDSLDEEPENKFLDIEDFRSEERELLNGPTEILSTEEHRQASPEAPLGDQKQSASVREEGGRFLHRTSRRMRRRRGGNRLPGQEQTATTAPEFAGARAGTAAAMEPVAREVRPAPVDDEHVVERPERVLPSIADLLKAGQEIIVQIAKEPLGQKGARITSHVALPGRFVVFMPSVSHLGVSRKIASDEERQRLKKILQAHRVGTTGGFIVRTAGEGVPEDEIAADMNFLYTLWLDIRSKAEKKPAPALLHYDLDIVQRILRDQVTEEFKAIWVDNEDMYENVLNFMQRFQPALVNRVKMYTRSAPIFDAFNITQELEKALRPKVWLKSGGYIVINQTEALVAIDINTGKYVGKSNRLEDTIVKTNTEAVKEIVRQIRLRDLGGIIVVDFIDMDERKNRQKVMQALEEAMQVDRAPYKILQFNDFGLVAITRKRVKQSLERTLCSPCPACEGAGYVKSVSTVIGEILVEAQKISKALESKDVVLRVHPEVAKVLKASSNRYLEELEEILGRPVLVTGDATLLSDKFDLG